MLPISPSPQPDYDSPWKEVIEQFFPQFILFFFPHIHTAIEWTKGYAFLDKEFQQITRDAQTGKRYVDKLVQVVLSDGQETWILIHIEVQGEPEDNFAERMFIYHYRIYDQYQQRVVSLAILTDSQTEWRPSHFGYEQFGCRISLDFPIVKLLDYRNQLEELAQHPNPFAVVVMAHLHTQTTRRNPAERYDAKLRLIRLLYERGRERKDILELMRFIDWVMTLPEVLAEKLKVEVTQYEESLKMRYVTSFEQIAKREGIQQGLQEGIQEGSQKNAQEFVQEALLTRFGSVTTTIVSTLEQIKNAEVLRELLRKAITADSLATFEKHLQDMVQPHHNN